MEAAARTPESKDTKLGERPMIRHGMIQLQAAGLQPPAPDPRVAMAISNANGTAPSRSLSRQLRAQAQPRRLFALIPALYDRGPTIADISRKLKSP